MVEPDGGRFTYGYSATNRNTLVVNPQGDRTTWQYDASSRVTVQRLANLVRTSMAYDSADRLVRLANLSSTGTTITSYVDTWDAAGNRLHRVEQDGTRVTWSYDSTYQLTNEQRSGANSYNTTYAYDPAGNRRFKLDNSVRTTYSYDAANQLQKYVDNTGTTTFSFDASGNQRLQLASAGGGTTTNTWDFENRLTKVALPSGVLNTFAYNGDNLRVQRQDSSGTLKELWDRLRILEETDQNNVVQAVYTLSPGVYGDVVSQRRSGTGSYFLFDPLGSTTRLTNASQGVTDTYLYKAFGEILLSGKTSNPFKFVGRFQYYLDTDLGFCYARRRYFSPATGKWLSADPNGFTSGDTNLTRYVRNNTMLLVDPTGLAPESRQQLLGLGEPGTAAYYQAIADAYTYQAARIFVVGNLIIIELTNGAMYVFEVDEFNNIAPQYGYIPPPPPMPVTTPQGPPPSLFQPGGTGALYDYVHNAPPVNIPPSPPPPITISAEGGGLPGFEASGVINLNIGSSQTPPESPIPPVNPEGGPRN